MILVDSAVWIDYFNGTTTSATDRLDDLLGVQPLATGDLIVTEVLQGFRHDRDFDKAREALLSLTVVPMLGARQAIRSAQNYRDLRQRGVTIRATIDVMIATYCIDNDHALLFSDRDFAPFVDHLGLRAA